MTPINHSGACTMYQEEKTDQTRASFRQPSLHNDPTVIGQKSAPQPSTSDVMFSRCKRVNSSKDSDFLLSEEGLSNGTCEDETGVHNSGGSGDAATDSDHLSLNNCGMSEFSNNDFLLPEVCISTNSNSSEDDLNYEVQQAYRIFTGFLLDKHKGITSPFLHPIGHCEVQHGIGVVQDQIQSQLRQSVCLQTIEEKFINKQYKTITEFVADFRLMLENCYRYYGVDHWISKQGQKLEIMLEQKLTLLSR